MRRPALIAAALALAACSSSTGSRTLPLEYRSVAPEQVADFSAQGLAGAIEVRDSYTTGVCHKSETRVATRSGSTVTLRIAHRRDSGQGCIDLGRVGAYEATIRGLEPGTYLLRVEYEGDIHSDSDQEDPSATVTVQ